jgi:serine/threonine protein kinase
MSSAANLPDEPTGDMPGRGSGPSRDFQTADDAPRSAAASGIERPGDMIGPYRLLEVIGEGGFGVVYLAERREPMVQRVALKVIKPGMDSKAVVARFEQERQALAMMDHPNVARVLDGGVTASGRPYFAMEHVKGETITAFADRNRLTIRERLELFIPVCEAVQHAHMKGIIHRDIKPSNILASSGGEGQAPVVKVIDFGVAKAISQTLTDKTIFTERGQIIGTPEYMSPEQAEMGVADIDTRTDIYSLGVVLYELLSGTLPFEAKTLRGAGYAEIQRIIREVDAPRPSKKLSTVDDKTGGDIARARQADRERIAGELRRELEWIPMKALRKDRARRYASAESLGADVRRYLEGKPLEAAPESRAYLARKFVRRNRVPVAAAVAVALTLVAGFGTALWQAREAAAQRDAAVLAGEKEAQQRARADERAVAAEIAEKAEKERADQLKKVSDFQSGMLAQIDTTTAGAELMRDVCERFAETLGKAGVPEAERTARLDVLRQELVRVNATDTAAAMIDRTILRPAIKTIDERFKDDPATDASLRQALSDLYQRIGRSDDAYPLQESALATRRRTLGEEHPDTLVSISNMGVLLRSQGRLAEAEPFYREALEKRRRTLGEEHPQTLASINNMGFLLQSQGRLAEAEPFYREALEKSRRTLGEEHPDTLTLINNMGALLRAQGRLAEAEPFYREALEKSRRTLGEEHPDTLVSVSNMGSLLQSHGRLAEAEPFYREALEKRRRTLGEEHPDTLVSVSNMLRLRVAQSQAREALDLGAPYEPAVRKAFTGGNARRLADFLMSLGRARAGVGDDSGRFTLAEANLLEAHAIYLEAKDRGPTHKDTLECAQALVDLYAAWDKAEPGKGYDAKAAEWRGKLPSEPAGVP